MLSAYQVNLITIVSIQLIIVLGVSVLTGFTRIFSFGNAGFMSIGAYTSAYLTTRLGVPFVIAVLAGTLLAGIIAYLLGSMTLKLEGDYFLITTLGFGECVRVLFTNLTSITGGAKGFTGIPKFTTMPIAVICALLALFLTWRIVNSKYGRNFVAVREQEVAAEAIGINTEKAKKMAFVFSALLAGWGGALYAHSLQYITPEVFGIAQSAEYTITVVIGGLGSVTGSVIGALLINLLPEVFRSLSSYRMLFYGIAVVAVIVLRPSGIFGYKEFSAKKILAWFKKLYHRINRRFASSNKDKGDA